MPECRSCGAPIVWAETERGKAMPLDPEPVPDGNLVVTMHAGDRHVRVSGGLEDPETPRYKAHFATCPNAAAHRRGDG